MSKQIKQSLMRAVSQLPRPDVQALWEQPVPLMSQHDYITAQTAPQQAASKPMFMHRALSFAAACACLIVVFFGAFGWYNQNLVATTVVDLDINPSIEITANSKDKVLTVEGLNPEAKLLLIGQSYKGLDLADAVEAITMILQQNGYLSQGQNAVLLSISGKDAAHSLYLGEEISGKIRLTADSPQTGTTVLRQTTTQQDQQDQLLRQQAQRFNVSPGKMRLATSLAAILPQYSIEQLLQLPLEALLEIVQILGDSAPEALTVDTSRFEQQPEPTPNPPPQDQGNGQQPHTPQPPATAPPTTPPPATPSAPSTTPRPQDDDDDNDDDYSSGSSSSSSSSSSSDDDDYSSGSSNSSDDDDDSNNDSNDDDSNNDSDNDDDD